MPGCIELYNEDCFEGMRRIPDGSIDLVLTDPPFACSQCEWDKRIDLTEFRKELERICKDKALFVSFSKQPFTTELMNAFRGLFRDVWYWKKKISTGFLSVNKSPLKAIEEILVFKTHKGATNAIYNPQKRKLDKPKKNHWESARKTNLYCNYDPLKKEKIVSCSYPTNFLGNYNANEKRFHPAQKPLEIVKYLIKTYSNEGMRVLDPFSGSGTVACACKDLNREFTGFEMDAEIFDKAIKRIKYE